MDLNTKRKALRLKILRKLLDPTCDMPWKDFMTSRLQAVNDLGIYNLCLAPTTPALRALPGFTGEALRAWADLRHLVVARPSEWENLKVFPLRYNPDLLSAPSARRDRMMSGSLEKAGFFKIGDVFSRFGEYSIEWVGHKFKERETTFRRNEITRLLNTFQEHLFEWWADCLGGDKQVEDEGVPLDFDVHTDKGIRRFTTLCTRSYYQLLLARVVKTPAAEHAWTRTFPTHDIASIWAKTYQWYIAPNLSNLEFKLKHRLIYTRTILSTIHPERYGRDCPVCGESPEDILHLFLTCPAIQPFWSRIQDLLARRLDWRLPVPAAMGGDDQEKWFLLFGPPIRKSTKENFQLCHLILTIARNVIYRVRNFHHFEQRTCSYWKIFTRTLTLHLKCLNTATEQRSKEHLFRNQKLMHKQMTNRLVLL